MREIECKKCGKKYDANFRSCPHCGNNPLRNVLTGILVGICVFMLTAAFANSIAALVRQKIFYEDLTNRIASIEAGSSGEQKGVNLNAYPEILNTYGIDDNTKLEELGNDYFLYFYQEGCVNCEVSNQYIVTYYYMGVNESVPIYLVNPESGGTLFDRFKVTGTPTLIRMVDGKETEIAEGYNLVYNALDPIVTEFSNKQS